MSHGLIGLFARHRVAANMLMLLMVLGGLWALQRLNTQFMPIFDLNFVTVRVVWQGASAEDIESGITVPLEQDLRTVDNLKLLSSTSAIGVSAITLAFYPKTDMTLALEQVKDLVAQQRNLPETALEPIITRVIRYEDIGRMLVSGPADLRELRPVVRRIEQELLSRGIARVVLNGMPKEEVAIQVPTARLLELEMSLDAVADSVARTSRDLPAGMAGRDDVAHQLRSLEQRRTLQGFAGIPLRGDAQHGLVTLGDVATIERRPRDGQQLIFHNGKPAVELQLQRSESADALESARTVADWMEQGRPRLPAGIDVTLYDQSWELIAERIDLLLSNGLGGLVLVLGMLYLFLSGRLAGRVALTIPVSFTAALAVLWLVGGSVNMISLFGLIMALGMIVDNAIVVSEHAHTLHQRGASTLHAAEEAAHRMFSPVMSSSITTVAAFIPLMLIGGIIGQILFDIPLVVICVILATLVITFLILPAQLGKTLQNMDGYVPGPFRMRFDAAFDRFRDHHFRRAVHWSVHNRGIALSGTLALLILSFGLLAGGRLGFTFFPSPDSTILYANVSFVAGTPPQRVEGFVEDVHRALWETDAQFGGGIVQTAVPRLRSVIAVGPGSERSGDAFGAVLVELTSPDRREVSNAEFIRAWQARLPRVPGLETFAVGARIGGPPGRDLEIRLTGADAAGLKAAALDLTEVLNDYPGVSAVEDDMPFGREQLIYRLTPEGRAAGLSVEAVGRQLRAAYDGRIAQIYQDGLDEIEVRVVLPDNERHRMASLERFAIVLPDGRGLPFGTVAELVARQGFEALRHADGRLAVNVFGDVERTQNNAGRVIASLQENVLPQLVARYGVDYSFQGRAADQAETIGDMQMGLVFALLMIYVTLAWVFGSYGWPLVVMAIIPFGLLGAVVGHWVMGMELTILSLFGLFGLTGIVVNNSIILVSFYQTLREEGMDTDTAIVEASCQRLRAVLLTSLTTIVGLVPLLFERSLQAQFLIPMAISLVFGLAFATVLVLGVIPALLSWHEQWAERLAAWRGKVSP
ncbi:MAG: efflux RND transporter permease subunit [Pseudomonadota bacterium]